MNVFAGITFFYQLINLVSFLYSLLCLIPSITIGLRRLNDIKQPWWLMLLPIAGYIGGAILSNIGAVIPLIGGLFVFVGTVLPFVSIIALFVLFALPSR